MQYNVAHPGLKPLDLTAVTRCIYGFCLGLRKKQPQYHPSGSCLIFVGRDLRALFGLLRRHAASNSKPPYAPLLLRTLRIMARHEGPSAFFDFANESAGILRTTPLQLPTSKGYSFATWLRIEEEGPGGAGVGAGAAAGQASTGRALYALLNRGTDTRGVIAALSG